MGGAAVTTIQHKRAQQRLKAQQSDGGGQGSILERWSGKASLIGDI